MGQVGRTARCDVMMSDANGFQPVVTVSRVDGSTVDYEMTPAISQEQLEKDVTARGTEVSGLMMDFNLTAE